IIKGVSATEVMLDDKVVIRLRKEFGGYSPYERAKIVSQHLAKLIKEGITFEDFKIEKVNGSTVITAKGEEVVATDLEAPLNNTTPQELARLWLMNIKIALENVSVVKSIEQENNLGEVKHYLDLAKEYLKKGEDTYVISTYRRVIKDYPR
ncbi:MAG TPA: hypothetical protein DHV62_07770, partial [Elusimicrobia bacterium]|nr:hypothetical protein [Elusimicrobiota bacterium]